MPIVTERGVVIQYLNEKTQEVKSEYLPVGATSHIPEGAVDLVVIGTYEQQTGRPD